MSNASTPPNAKLTQLPDLAARQWMAQHLHQHGPMGFDWFMQQALYHPQFGYYSKGASIFGTRGDFITAPGLSPLFGQTVARAIGPTLGKQVAPVIYEFGAGLGQLAAQVLQQLGDQLEQYCIVDVSGGLRDQQEATLRAALPAQVANKVKWLDTLPDALHGWVLGNELLDSMPVRRFTWRTSGVSELKVGLASDAPNSADFLQGIPVLKWVECPADRTLTTHVQTLHAQYGPWPSPYCSEVAEQAFAWVSTITERLHGAVLMVDYGRDASQFYAPHQDQGLIRAHSQHVAHDGFFEAIGLQDLTCHVDFSAIYNALSHAGGNLEGYCTQSAFLRYHGLLDLAAQDPTFTDPTSGAAQRQAVNMLLSEAEMGESFKVMCWSKSTELTGSSLEAGFLNHDLSHLL